MAKIADALNTFVKFAAFFTALVSAYFDNYSYAAFLMATAVWFAVQPKET